MNNIMSSVKNDHPIAGKQRPAHWTGARRSIRRVVPVEWQHKAVSVWKHHITNTVLARSMTNWQTLTCQETIPYLPNSGFTRSNSRARKIFARPACPVDASTNENEAKRMVMVTKPPYWNEFLERWEQRFPGIKPPEDQIVTVKLYVNFILEKQSIRESQITGG